MNHRLAPLRSPVALLTGIALLCAALAGVLAFSGRAHAATQLGKFTITPTTGSISTYPMITSVTTTAGCPDDTAGKAAVLKVFNPTSDTSQATLGQGATKIVAGSGPFTMDVTTLAAAKSLETRLRTWIPDGSLDGTYTLGLGCGGGTDVPVFLAKVRVAGDTWSLLEQQPTTLAVSAASDVAVGGALKLTATVSPATAAGSVEFRNGDTSLGTAQVTNGTAELTVTAPAVGGPMPFSAVFTPGDADAYSSAEATGSANIDYLVSAKDADGNALGDKPTLSIGQKVKVTAKGFTPGATVAVTLTLAGNSDLGKATANADGAVADYAFTVPDALPNSDHALNFSEKSGIYAAFDFVSTDADTSSPSPTENPDLTVTDEDGNTLDTNPNLEAGQKVKITARGYTASAAVKVTLADGDAMFDDAKADSDGTVKNYAFTVPKDIADGDHTLTLAEDKTDGHSVDFAFTTGSDDSSESPEPSASASDSGGTDTGGTGGGSDTGGSTGGDTGGSGSGGGSMASTGAQAGAIGLASLAFLSAGGALVLHMRRKGLLTFGGDTPQHR
ncbi:Ig-like domain-containing protein [Streptomyces sp. NPDC094038]|uniref:Ig-like domain-containing protein n=1 Tax=Streptomyces sp. NPDC094038 TaxID=3366055 RepID=UPI00381A0F03